MQIYGSAKAAMGGTVFGLVLARVADSRNPMVQKSRRADVKVCFFKAYCGDDRASCTLECLKRHEASSEEAAERDSWIPGFVPTSGTTATIQ